ncbi:MAG: MFS transporter [Zoogloea sp.]|nr:MFS transporter [Zoogloea sp.]MCA0186454.1 MFS transporter [Pseudomonadota bacterium]
MSTSPAATERLPRDFRLYLLISVVGATVHFGQAVAVGWSIYEQTGTAMALGLVGLAQFLPILFFFLPAGQVADRFERRSVIVVSLLLTLLATLLLALCAGLRLSPGWTYGALVLTGCAQILNRPARDALMPTLVAPARLAPSIALATSLHQIASMAAPALAGFGLALFHSALPIHLFNACITLLALAATLAIRQRSRGHAHPASQGRMAEILAGFTHIWRQRLLLAVMSIDLFAVLFGGAVALLPVYAKDILHVGPAGLGLLSTAPAIGAATAGLIVARHGVSLDGRLFLGAIGGFGLMTVIFGLSSSFVLSLAALILLGGFDSISVVQRSTVIQQGTPDALRGRVAAVNRVFISSSNELGALESGLLASLTGPVVAVVAGGLMTIAIVLLAPRVFPELGAMRPASHDPDGIS